MLSSVKQSRVKTSSHSNKKTNLSCHSNKSLKTLAESNANLNIDHTKRHVHRAGQVPINGSKPTSTINVKSLKQRAIGRGLNESIRQPFKTGTKIQQGKENHNNDYMTKSKKS